MIIQLLLLYFKITDMLSKIHTVTTFVKGTKWKYNTSNLKAVIKLYIKKPPT